MPTRDKSTNDELVKARRQPEPQNGPRADGSGGDASSLLSALGNSRVQRLMRSAALHRSEDGSGTVDDAVAKTIQAKRGGGSPLDESARRNLEPSFGDDFSDVRVHTDSSADSLNRAVKAEAFTTGTDIFFRSGSYNPGSSDGQKLLAHELTHVVQQRNAPPPSEMTVSSPDDASEIEAAQVADSVSASTETAPVSRAAVEEEEPLQASFIDRQMEEEEPEIQGSFVDRAMEEEEEPLVQGSFIDRATPEDEELMQGSFIDREAEDAPRMV
jgi:hypothetical protein